MNDSTTSLKNITILIVEDEAIISMHISKIIERLGFTVCAVISFGEEVLETVERLSPDLILMDIMLAGDMDGIVAAALVKEKYDVPIVYLTGNADRSTVEKARSTEPFGYLSKPVSDRDVFAAIDTAIFKHNMELKLRESEERFRFLSENSSDMIYRMSLPDGIYEYVSPASVKITGFTSEEFYENPQLLKEQIHPDSVDYLKEQWENLLNGIMPPVYEYKIIDKEGRVRWNNQRNTLIKNKEGTAVAIQGVVTDVTETKEAMETIERQNKELEYVNQELRKTMQELEATNEELYAAMEEQEAMNDELIAVNKMLAESEQQYRQLFDTIDTCVAVYEAVDGGNDFVFKQFNAAAEKTEQIERHRLIGEKVTEVFPGVIEFGLFDVFKRVWKTGNPESLPVSLYKDNRIEGWKENFVYKLPGGEVVAVYKDITEKKKAELSLKESEEKLRTMIEKVNTGMFISTFEGEYIYVNPAIVDIVGYDSIQELLQTPVINLYADHKEREHFINRLKKDGSVKNIVLSAVKKDGTVFKLSMSATLYFDKYSNQDRILGTVHEI